MTDDEKAVASYAAIPGTWLTCIQVHFLAGRNAARSWTCNIGGACCSQEASVPLRNQFSWFQERFDTSRVDRRDMRFGMPLVVVDLACCSMCRKGDAGLTLVLRRPQ